MNKLQQIELDIMVYIDAFCRKNGISYFLGGGSLIGAIRHKGFIPWDDDIDVFMKRSDYDKFIKLFNSSNHKFYKLYSLQTDSSYNYPFVKVVDNRYPCMESDGRTKRTYNLGLWVDIFPLDYYKNSYIRKQRIKFLVFRYGYSQQNSLNFGSTSQKSIFLKICKFFIYIMFRNSRKYALRIEKLSSNNKKCSFLYIGMSPFGEKNVYPIEWFNETIESDFEGNSFMIPKEYDKVLRKQFGNYMELPPIEERTNKHEIILIEKSNKI